MTKKITQININFLNKKSELRRQAKKYRQNEPLQNLDEKIVKKIKFTIPYTSSQNVMLFYPLPYEINILPLLNDKKNFSFPTIKEDKIVPLIYNGKFHKGRFNINEPFNSTEQNPLQLDLVIAPALFVDKKGYRLGYGKGYYDKFIKTLNRNRTKILTPMYNAMVIDDIGADEFDEKVDFIVTEDQIISF